MTAPNKVTEPAISYEAFRQMAPDAYKALLALGKSVDDAGLEKTLRNSSRFAFLRSTAAPSACNCI